MCGITIEIHEFSSEFDTQFVYVFKTLQNISLSTPNTTGCIARYLKHLEMLREELRNCAGIPIHRLKPLVEDRMKTLDDDDRKSAPSRSILKQSPG